MGLPKGAESGAAASDTLVSVPRNFSNDEQGVFHVAKMRTDSGKTFNIRGLQRQAGNDQFEFAYEMEGVGSNGAGKAAVPTGTGSKARQTINRLRDAGR